MSLDITETTKTKWFALDGAEILVLRIAAALMIINAGLLIFRGGAIDAQAYSGLFALAIFVGALGQFYRLSGRGTGIGDALTCLALMLLFSNSALVFNFLLLPLNGHPIDGYLLQFDTWLGYSWPGIVSWAGDVPWFNELSRFAYISVMPQLTILILLLGFMGKKIWLHRMLLLLVTTTVVLIAFWSLFPSHGPSAMFTLSDEVAAKTRPMVTSEYGQRLLTMMISGPETVTPAHVEGLIAFPSYHTTMAFICTFAAIGLRKLFPVFLVLNLIVLPGTLIHGGHHLADLFGGAILFGLGVWMAERIVRAHLNDYESTQSSANA